MSNSSSEAALSPVKQALLKVRDLKQQLAEAQQQRHEKIAVVSVACRFPRKSDTPEAFWQSLLNGSDEIGEVPADRWDLQAYYDADAEAPGKMYARRGAFLDKIDQMDADFFGISPREATWVDPQQRLFLEVGWEALERAGWTAEISQNTGVFIGWMHNDYQNEGSDSLLDLNPYIATGAAGSFLSGRLSYFLGARGPSLAVDTACSSSLVALHLACQSLRQGECERAIVGGVNVMTSPKTTILTCKLHALSPQGHSRAFDASADGYLRGEGCGVVTLKRLSDAQRDGDRVLAVIRGSALSHNGFSSGLTAPNPDAQQQAIRDALKSANIDPADVAYLEAHGTGTELGDPLEMQAAAAALTVGRDRRNPLLVGSVKTNIGHLEAAAGMAGLIKVILAIEHDQIPPHLNFEVPNPHIKWDQLPVKIVTETTAWPSEVARIAGVSAFGMSGTNAHVVIEGPPTSIATETPAASQVQRLVESKAASAASAEKARQVLVLSGKSDTAVQQLAGRYRDWLALHPDVDLADLCYTTGAARRHFERRAAVIPESVAHAQRLLAELADGQVSDEIVRGYARTKPVVAWQFTGQGSQYLGMGKQLYAVQPVFRSVLDRCDAWLRKYRPGSLVNVLFDREELLHDTTWTQPALFAIHMGLAELLQSWDLQPDAVLGHSLGQYAAACVAGMLNSEDALGLIHERSRLTGGLPAGGGMAAVFASSENVQSGLHADLSVAALNGSHIVISGDSKLIDEAVSQFNAQGVRAKRLKTSHAFHSALLDPVLDEFEAIAGSIRFRTAHCPVICNVTGEAMPANQTVDGAYWRRQLRAPVRYSDCIRALEKLGCDVVLELGPQPILTGMASACWTKEASALIPTLLQGQDESLAIATSVARLYARGVDPDFTTLYGSQQPRKLVLPTYPFQRKEFWGPAKPGAAQAAKGTEHPLLGARRPLAGVQNEQRFEQWLAPDDPRWLSDHQVFGDTVFPGAAYVEMAVAACGRDAVLEDLAFEVPLTIGESTCLQSILRTTSEQVSFEIHSMAASTGQWSRNCSAKVTKELRNNDLGASKVAITLRRDDSQATQPSYSSADLKRELDPPAVEALPTLLARCEQAVDVAEFYEMFEGLGLQYGPQFQTIESLHCGEAEVLAKLTLAVDQRGYSIPPMLLDGAFQSLAVGLFRDPNSSLFIPVGIDRFCCFSAVSSSAAGGELWSHAKWTESEGDLRTADITLFDERGNTIAFVEQLKLRPVSRAALRRMVGTSADRLLYSIDWREQSLPEPITSQGRWLVVRESAEQATAESQRQADRIVQELQAKGQHCVSAQVTLDAATDPPAGPEPADSVPTRILANQAAAWESLLRQHFTTTATGSESNGDEQAGLSGVVWLIGTADDDDSLSHRFRQTELHCSGILALLHALRSCRIEQLERGLQLVTQKAIAVDATEAVSAHSSQFWGYGRVIGSEHPVLRCRLVDIAQFDSELPKLVDVLLTDSRESQIAIRDRKTYASRLVPLRATNEGPGIVVDSGATYLITGGLGMLGRRAAQWLARHGAGHIVLVSRRPASGSTLAMIEEIEQSGCRVHVKLADVSDSASVDQLWRDIEQTLPPVKGIVHAAGVLNDGLVAEQSWGSFEKVLGPKVTGAWMLHRLSADQPLDFFILYSSAASVLGSPGQANYAMANAFLDGLAHQRVAAGLPALSVNWGPWDEGMAATETVTKALSRQGMTPLTADEAHEALERLFVARATQATVLDVDWKLMRQRLPVQAPPLLDTVWPESGEMAPGTAVLLESLSQLQGAARKALLVAHVQSELQHILSLPQPPEPDVALADLGLDSLMAVELSTRLQQQVGSQHPIPPTIAFDFPTVAALADHLLNLLQETAPTDEPVVVQQEVADETIAIVGLGCRFPGANNIEEYWQLLRDGVDATSELPEDRWDLEKYYDPLPTPGKMYTRRGGFLQDIDQFDADFFGVSDAEARWLDPQHRLLLEVAWEALENAGMPPQQMQDSLVGVFMGIMSTDYAQLHENRDASVIESFQGAGFSHSAGVGRISYLFGLEGPCMAVDSASSSSLVAVCQAVRSLLDGECNLALAGGVNAILSPTNTLLLCHAGMLSPDGRCKSFSDDADGFGRGEGCGVVVLKRRSDAERDGDRILAVIRGTAVSHNGNSGGLTAPSGRSQERLLRKALASAGLSGGEVQYLEAHGTGTALGDPIELGAAAAVFGKGRSADHPLLVGSAKANIGHLEAAGGVSGLIKVVLSMQHASIPSQIHFDKPSRHVLWDKLRAKVVVAPTPWPDATKQIAGVTALGMSGTNAHVVLEGGVLPTTAADANIDRSHHLLVLSGKTPAALRELAKRYCAWLAPSTEIDARSARCQRASSAPQRAPSENLTLADACFTAGVGRRHLEHRAAIVVDTSARACQILSSLAAGQPAAELWQAQAQSSTKLAWVFPDASDECAGVGQELYATQPDFRSVIDQCDQQLREVREGSLIEAMFASDGLLNDPSWSHPASFALHMGLSKLWQAWGIEPDLVWGLGLGQYAAACVAGVMKWQDGLLLANERGQLCQAFPSGLEQASVEALDRFETLADKLDYFPADRELVCAVTGELVPVHQLLAGNYWRKQLTAPIAMDTCCETIDAAQCDLLLEIGLGSNVAEVLDEKLTQSRPQRLPSLQSGMSETASLLSTLARMHVRGLSVDFRAVDRPWSRRKIQLPTYAFQRKRYWLTDLAPAMAAQND